MKFKRIIIFIFLIVTILSFFSLIVFADYSGYFLKGFADGFKSGFQMGMQKKEMKWKTEQLEELDTPELGKKFLVLNFLLPMDLQEHGQSLFNGIVSVDKDKVAEEKQYFKNVIDTINLTSGQINSETLGNLSNLLSKNKKVLINTIMESGFSYTTSQSELKYNSFENKWEYAPSNSILKYNPFSNSWSYE